MKGKVFGQSFNFNWDPEWYNLKKLEKARALVGGQECSSMIRSRARAS